MSPRSYGFFFAVMLLPPLAPSIGATSKNYSISENPVSAPGAHIRQALANEPLWSSLSRTPEEFEEAWRTGSEVFKKYPVADRNSIFEMQNTAAQIWRNLVACNGGDPNQARESYYEGTFCRTPAPWNTIRPAFIALLSNIDSYLKTTWVDPSNNSGFVKAYLYPISISSSPLFNELLLESYALASIYPETLDRPLMRLARKKGITAELKPALVERVRITESAGRSLLLTAKDCADYGLWPTLSGSVFAWDNLTTFFSIYALSIPLDQAGQYYAKVYTDNMMACGEHLIRWNLETYHQVHDQVEHYRDDPTAGILFYRFLAQRNLRLLREI